MFKRVFLILITISLISTSNLYAEKGSGALEAMQEHINRNKNKSSNYSRGLTHIKKAIKFEKKQKFEKANNYYKKTINYFLAYNKQYGVYPDTLYYLGFSYEKIQDIENAILYYQIGLELKPKDINMNKHLAEIYLKESKFDLANEILEVLKDCNCEEYNIIKEKLVKN
jgi:tetratricopeptide (TPR) repeat protein